MARPVKKSPEQWKNDILSTAQKLFTSKGYNETSISDIMEAVGGAKGMFYRCFESKEELMQTLGDEMFFQNNPFEIVKKHKSLNGLQKMREIIKLSHSNNDINELNLQSMSILNDPRILASAIEANCRILTPLWFELLDEGVRDGSIKTEYAKEISELLPLMNFWILPTIYPDTPEGIKHKFQFIKEVFAKMGLPIFDDEIATLSENQLNAISQQQLHEG